MTFRLLIVDDEPIICRGLSLTIPWEEHQIEVVDTANDGAEAIQKIKDDGDIDLVMTDVRMPKVDGLELASFLASNFPQIRIIMISGYDEFKYAQQAIHLGVKDYLLKPVDVDELLDVVARTTHELQVERTELQQIHYTHLKNAIYHQVLDFSVKVSEDVFEGTRVYPFITMLTNYMETMEPLTVDGRQTVKTNWIQLLEANLEKKGYTSISIYTGENVLLTCIVDYKKTLSYQDLLSMVKEVDFHPSFSLLFVLNKTEVKLGDLYPTYLTLFQDRQYLPFSDDRYVISPIMDNANQQKDPNDIENDLINALFQYKQEEILDATNLLFNYLERNQFFLEDAVQINRELITRILNRYESLFRKATSQIKLSFKQSVDTNLYNSYALLKELFQQDIKEIITQLNLKHVESKDWLIEKAEKYITTYYTSHIKAQEVADYINISPNYFSSLFKQKTGKSFSEYINELRVEKAKVLLEETPFKVNEIAEKVGYHEYKYFVDVFKKITGLTPTKYRQLSGR